MTPMQASRALRQLARVPSKVAPEVARGIRADLMRRFALGQDPYGKAWAPLKLSTLRKGRRPPPLTDTGRGKRGIRFAPQSGAGIRITSSVGYMRHHMRATADRAARKFLPEGRLPAAWARLWEKALARRARETLRG